MTAQQLEHLGTSIKSWWDKLNDTGPRYGYFVNSSKTWLIVKDPAKIKEAEELFNGTDVNITSEGRKHLGAAIGSDAFKSQFIREKVEEWRNEVVALATIANSEPQLAYSAYIFGLSHKWTYYLRTIENISEELKPLEDAINNILFSALLRIHLSRC